MEKLVQYEHAASRIRAEINSHPLTDYVTLEKSRPGFYCCPICRSGHKGKGTGALKLYAEPHRAKCYSGGCFTDKGTDTLGALRILNPMLSEAEVFKKYGYMLTDYSAEATQGKPAPQPAAKREGTKTENKMQQDYTEQYKQWHSALLQSPEALEYLHGRGITDAAIERYQLGYCDTWAHPKTPKYTSKRVIVPRTEGSYLARAISPEVSKDYQKQIVGTQNAIFNAASLDSYSSADNEPIFIVEGELDAISLLQDSEHGCGLSYVIGIGSASKDAAALAKYLQTRAPAAVYVLALDSDIPGVAAQIKLAEAMKETGLVFISADTKELYAGRKDANEAVQTEQAYKAMLSEIDKLMGKAYELRQEVAEKEAAMLAEAAGVDAFFSDIQTEKYKPIPTGLTAIDKMLDGGLTRQTLVFLGAFPGAGKTTLAAQIFEYMAAHGKADILYLNLEMSRNQLLARSIARRSAEDGKQQLTASQVTRGYAWTEQERKRVTELVEAYKKDTAPHMVYNPGKGTALLEDIIQTMNAEADRLARAGKPAPIVIIDYLQLVQTSGHADAAETIKQTVKALKDYAMQRNTVVFVITANNRNANKDGRAGADTGRDTSNIEYSADIQLQLTYAASDTGESKQTVDEINEKRKAAADAGRAIPHEARQYVLRVTKSRACSAWGAAKLYFDAEHNRFILSDTTEAKAAAKAGGFSEPIPVKGNAPLPW